MNILFSKLVWPFIWKIRILRIKKRCQSGWNRSFASFGEWIRSLGQNFEIFRHNRPSRNFEKIGKSLGKKGSQFHQRWNDHGWNSDKSKSFNPAIRFRDIFGHPRINFLSNMGIISFSHIGWHFFLILWWWWVWRVMIIFSDAIARKPHAAGAQMGE